MTASEPPVVHGDERTPPTEGADTRDTFEPALIDRLRAAAGFALGGESVDDFRRQSDLRGWTGVGFDRDVDAAVAATLAELAEVLEDERRDHVGVPRLQRLAEVVERGEFR